MLAIRIFLFFISRVIRPLRNWHYWTNSNS